MNYTIKKIADIDELKRVWDMLVVERCIYDDWTFRYIFYKYDKYPIACFVASAGGHEVGMLPLQHNTYKNVLEFFGGNFMEENRVYCASGHEAYKKALYDAIKGPVALENVDESDALIIGATERMFKYTTNLQGLANADAFILRQFGKASGNRMLKNIHKIDELQPEIIENRFEDIEQLFALNEKNFGVESTFYRPHRKDMYRDMLTHGYAAHLLTVVIDSIIRGVSTSILYQDTYYGFNSGVDTEAVPNLGKYMTYRKIEQAIRLGAKKYDAGLEDFGWKETWHFDKIPQYYFTR